MRINCSLCGVAITSVILDKAIAMKEISISLTRHVMKKHPNETEDLRKEILKLMPLLDSYITWNTFGDIPEHETYIQEKLEEGLKCILEALDIDTNEEGEEEEEGEEIEEIEEGEEAKLVTQLESEKLGRDTSNNGIEDSLVEPISPPPATLP